MELSARFLDFQSWKHWFRFVGIVLLPWLSSQKAKATELPKAIAATLAEIKLEINEHSPSSKKSEGNRKLANLYYGLGCLSGDESWYGKGLDLIPNPLVTTGNAEDYILWAALKGKYELSRGKLLALFAIPEIEKALLLALAKDPNGGQAAAHRGLARLYDLAPSVISVGSRSKAESHYLQALQIAPDLCANRIYYAGFLANNGNREKATALVENIQASCLYKQSPYEFADLIPILEDLQPRTSH